MRLFFQCCKNAEQVVIAFRDHVAGAGEDQVADRVGSDQLVGRLSGSDAHQELAVANGKEGARQKEEVIDL
jgi:hypothetical protein